MGSGTGADRGGGGSQGAAPAVVSRSFTSSDGTPLRADFYSDPAGGGGSGVVVIVHGYCEHRGRYRHVAAHLVRHGYSVLAGDLRGHGESGGERGFVRRFGEYLDDVTAFLSEAKALQVPAASQRVSDRPILLGHSMGGLVSLEYVLAHPGALRAVALSSPFLGLKIRVPAWKRALALAASLAHPTLRLPNELEGRYVSHDPEVVAAYDSDPLVTHDATARWFTETMAAQADVRARANRIKLPVLMLHAGDDRVVDAAVSQEVFTRIGAADKMLSFYPGLYHEIFNEVTADRERVLTDLTNWLKDR